jgi:hypothetical protein
VPTCEASFSGSDLFMPSVGRGEGNLGSMWYTTVWLYNPGASTADVTVSLLRKDQANLTPEQQIVVVPAGSTMVLDDALLELFGLESVNGALRFQCETPILAGARIYNQPGETIRESQGQLMPGMPAHLAIGPGESTDIPGVLQPADGSFRCSFGMVETSGALVQVRVTLRDGDGIALASRVYTLSPYSAFQRSLSSLSSGISVEIGRLHLEVVGGSGSVLAFASAVANGTVSQDPTTLEMSLEPSSSPGSGITGVVAGPGLLGGGSSGDVTLQVKAGSGIAVSADGVSIKPSSINAGHVASGELMLGTEVDGTILRDIVTLEAGEGVTLEASESTVTISAPETWERIERTITETVTPGEAGEWVWGDDLLQLPGEGRWRVGYRVLIQMQNLGTGVVSSPVNVALINLTDHRSLVRRSLSVVGLQVGVGGSQLLTVDGEAVIDVSRATSLAIAGRTSSTSLRLTIHPDDVNVSSSLDDPDSTSFLYAERLPSGS